MATVDLTPEQRANFSKTGKSNVRTAKAHERRVAKLLASWSGVPFRRRRVEGRDSAVRVVELTADVIPCAGDFKFSIECKKGKDFSLDSLMANPTGSLFTNWWHQSCYDAQLLTGDLKRPIFPMMFFKPHPNWDWVAFSAHAIDTLRSQQPLTIILPDNQLWFPHLRFDMFGLLNSIVGDISHSKKNKKLVGLKLDPLVICRWRDFELNVAPQSAFAVFPTAETLTTLANTDTED